VNKFKAQAKEEIDKMPIEDITEDGEAKFSLRYEPTCPSSKFGKDWRLCVHGIRARLTCPKNHKQTSQGFNFTIDMDDDDAEFRAKIRKSAVLAKGWIHDRMCQAP
jgi:hypothetical protein